MACKLVLVALLGQITRSDLSFMNQADAERFGSSIVDFRFFTFSKAINGQQLLARLRKDPDNGCTVSRPAWRITDNELPYASLVRAGGCGLRTKILTAQLRNDLFLIVALPPGSEDMAIAGLDIDLPVVIVEEAKAEKLGELEGAPLRLEVATAQRDAVILRFAAAKGDDTIWGLIGEMQDLLQQFDSRLTVEFGFYADGPGDAETAKLQAMAACLPPARAVPALLAFKKNCLGNNITVADCFQSQVELRDQRSLNLCMQSRGQYPPALARPEPPLPRILINDLVYTGAWRSEELFSAVCSAFLSSPDNCLFIHNRFVANPSYRDYRSTNEVDKYLVIIAICVIELSLLFMVGLIFAAVYSKLYGGVVYEKVPEIVKDSMVAYRSFTTESSRRGP